jgi:hypothetical protein
MSGSGLFTAEILTVSACLVAAGVSKARVSEDARAQTLVGVFWRDVFPGVPARGNRSFKLVWRAVLALEVLIGLGLLVSAVRVAALLATTIFFSVAVALSSWGLWTKRQSTCGCLGAGERNSGWTLTRTSWFLLGATACLLSGAELTLSTRQVPTVAAFIVVNGVVVGSTSLSTRRFVARGWAAATHGRVRRVRSHAAARDAVETIRATPYWATLIEVGILEANSEPSRIWTQNHWLLIDVAGRDPGCRVIAGVLPHSEPRWCRVAVIALDDDPPATTATWDSLAQGVRAAGSTPRSSRPSPHPGAEASLATSTVGNGST